MPKSDLPPITRETTIHLGKLLHRVTFKRKAPRAIRAIKRFAAKAMKTDDVRIDVDLNKQLWARGIRGPPRRIRVRLERRRNADGANQMYTLVTHVPLDKYGRQGYFNREAFRGLTTITVDQ